MKQNEEALLPLLQPDFKKFFAVLFAIQNTCFGILKGVFESGMVGLELDNSFQIGKQVPPIDFLWMTGQTRSTEQLFSDSGNR